MSRGYKRDVVRGRQPQLDPVNYKPDTLLQVWIDARKLVMLDNWLSKNGIRTRYMADIGREVLDIVVDQLLSTGEVEKVEFSREATDALKYKFRKIDLNPGGRGKRNIQHNLVLDSRRERGLMEDSDHGIVPGVSRQRRIWEEEETEEEIEEKKAIEIAKEAAWKKIEEEYLEKARSEATSRLQFDENGVVVKGSTTGYYTAEQRIKEVEQARKNLGLDQATKGSVITDGSKSVTSESVITSEDDNLNTDNDKGSGDEKGVKTPASADEVSRLLDKIRDKKVISANQDLTPRKLTSYEIESKEEALRKKDLEFQSKLSSVRPDDLRPIE